MPQRSLLSLNRGQERASIHQPPQGVRDASNGDPALSRLNFLNLLEGRALEYQFTITTLKFHDLPSSHGQPSRRHTAGLSRTHSRPHLQHLKIKSAPPEQKGTLPIGLFHV